MNKKTALFITLFFYCCFGKILFAHENVDDFLMHLKQEMASEQQNFPQGDLLDKEYVKLILGEMETIDQKVREEAVEEFGGDLINHPEVWQILCFMDDFHTVKMKEILQQYGWITISQFGEVSDNQAWLLVQHSADLFFQEGCLFVLSNVVNQGETSKKNYAYLYDRVAIQSPIIGKQRYGTQLDFDSVNNKFVPFPYEGTMEELNQRRIEMGLNSEEENLEDAKKVYHIEN